MTVTKNQEYGVAIVGGGNGCLELLDLFAHIELEEFKGRVLAVADIFPDAPGIIYANNMGLITTDNFRDFYSHPDIEIIIELTGDKTVLDSIYSSRPAHIKVIDHDSARLFWDLIRLKSEKGARTIIESTQDAFILANKDFKIIQYNKAAERMFVKHKSLVGRPAKAFMEEVFGSDARRLLEQNLGTVHSPLIAYQATPYQFAAEVNVVESNFDQDTSFVLFIRDISESLAAREEISRLHVYEDLFEQINTEFSISHDFEQSLHFAGQLIKDNIGIDRVAICLVDPQKQKLTFKGQWKDQEHREHTFPLAFIEKHLPAVWKNVSEANMITLYNADTLGDPDRTSLQSFNITSVLNLPITANSGAVWGVIILIDNEPRICFDEEIDFYLTLIKIIRNPIQRNEVQKALRKTELYYKTIFQAAGSSMLLVNDDTTIILANTEFEKLSGYNRDEIENKLSWTQFFADDDLPGMKNYHYLRRLTPDRVPRNYECRFIDRFGRTRDLFCTVSMIPGTKESVSSFLDLTLIKQAQNDLFESFNKLQRSLQQTVNALASTVELRDPYTAGHQRNVASLAKAIAIEMGLSEECIDGIEVAGTLHDIGKITVPAEILSKPSSLTKAEFSLITSHSTNGYNILKDIEFPRPVATILLQHHERTNGSGYPSGLIGEDIRIEARILAVADVVEAMASHRPYRPSLGIEKALNEVANNKGILYDAEVVDACINLFNSDAFHF